VDHLRSNSTELPSDKDTLQLMVLALLEERDQQKRHAEEQKQRAEEHSKQAAVLQIELLRVKLELERYKKWYYGPRADYLQSDQDVAQMLLNFAEELDCKPVPAEDLAAAAEPAEALRRVKRRKGRRNLANFESLPVSTQVYELSEAERACPCCGLTRKEIGADESWQVEYLPGHFERIHHVRKKYACASCETNGENPSIEAAKKPETVIDKGLAGPGLLAYIVTSKFSDFLPLYRLEDIFARQGFEISRATQSVWCGVSSLFRRGPLRSPILAHLVSDIVHHSASVGLTVPAGVEPAVSARRAGTAGGTDAGTVNRLALVGVLNAFCSFPMCAGSGRIRFRFR
jgi:transposase